MNFAGLIKISGHPGGLSDALVSQARSIISKAKFQNQTEVAFYLSADNAAEFYFVSFCYSLDDVEQAESILYRELFSTQFSNQSKTEQDLFRLSWEYRLVNLTPAASHLRLTTYPKNYPQRQLEELINLSRQNIRKTPGSIGAWLGHSISGEAKILSRGDWNSLGAQFEYVGAQVLQDTRTRRLSQGIEAHYASFQLHSVIRPDNIIL